MPPNIVVMDLLSLADVSVSSHCHGILWAYTKRENSMSFKLSIHGIGIAYIHCCEMLHSIRSVENPMYKVSYDSQVKR